MPGWINVPVHIETRNRLDKIKRDDKQSYDALINELIDQCEQIKTNAVKQDK